MSHFNSAPSVTHSVYQVAHGFSTGQAVYFNGANWSLAKANSFATLGIGIVITIDANSFVVFLSGTIHGLSGLTPGQFYYVSDTNAGSLTTTEPTQINSYSNPLLFALSANSGIVLPFRPKQISENAYATAGLILPKTSGSGIQVDLAAPTFPWYDLIGEVNSKGTGSNNPNWAVYRGSIYQYQFSVGTEVWANYHIPHDWLPGSDMFIHVHWSHNSASVVGGSVTWAFDMMVAKGFDQAPFSAPVSTSVSQNASTTRYQHMISEVQISSNNPNTNQLNNNLIEVDSILVVHAYLSANSMGVNPFAHSVDIHYQSTGIGTKQKAPNFYV